MIIEKPTDYIWTRSYYGGPQTLHDTGCRWADPGWNNFANTMTREKANAHDVTFIDGNKAVIKRKGMIDAVVYRCRKCRPLQPKWFINDRKQQAKVKEEQARQVRRDELMDRYDAGSLDATVKAIKAHFTLEIGKDGAARVASNDDEIKNFIGRLFYRGEMLGKELDGEAATEQPQSNGEAA